MLNNTVLPRGDHSQCLMTDILNTVNNESQVDFIYRVPPHQNWRWTIPTIFWEETSLQFHWYTFSRIFCVQFLSSSSPLQSQWVLSPSLRWFLQVPLSTEEAEGFESSWFSSPQFYNDGKVVFGMTEGKRKWEPVFREPHVTLRVVEHR